MIRSLPDALLNEVVESHGGDSSSVRSFTSDGPDLLQYATLLAARSHNVEDFGSIQAIYEWDGRPLIILVDETQVRDPAHLSLIRRAAAMRGDAPYLGVVGSGRLTIYVVALDSIPVDAARLQATTEESSTRALIPHLGNTRPVISSRCWISDIVLRLLTDTIDAIVKQGVRDGDAISLVGRALFIRFLADRALLKAGTLPAGFDDPATLFDTREGVEVTAKWLDDTFNGDFLPLAPGIAKTLPDGVLLRLGDVLRRAPSGQLYLGWQEAWDRLDFAQIPVGVLSQAYERYLSRHDPLTQKREGGYYTPRHIADLMVRASFLALERDGRAAGARVLDPAAGAGVFLITAFRQLVAQQWKETGKRPDTAALRSILQEKITGFDINESALRFAALGLYLISIELDPNPEPIQKLRFENLRPHVLRKVEVTRREEKADQSDRSDDDRPGLGSLGPEIGQEHLGAYDLVIGNPPWASSTQLRGWSWLEKHVTQIARMRAKDNSLKAPLPNEVLDLPFLWRSLEWARPGGQIAFALHARLLFQQGETMPDARRTLFQCLDITGIINGTELRQTRVWPEISAPFCLLFARNSNPAPGAAFKFVTPRLDDGLNQAGAWRIDVTNAETVSLEEAQRRPTILKTLFRGTRLDAEVLDRIETHGWPSLEEYWADLFGKSRGKPKASGNGFQRLRPSSRVRGRGDGLPGASAAYLHGFRLADAEDDLGLLIDATLLDEFAESRIHDPRPIEIFRGPILIVRESPPVRNGRMKVSVSQDDIVYSQSFHGYSAHEYDDGLGLTKYIALLVSSKLSLWRALMTSGRFGFEREVVEKFIIDKLPIKPFDELTGVDKENINILFERVKLYDDESSWRDVDRWVSALYQLEEADIQCIDDTLRLNLPFAENRWLGQSLPTQSDMFDFCTKLIDELKEWWLDGPQSLKVNLVSRSPLSPWQFVQIGGREAGRASSIL